MILYINITRVIFSLFALQSLILIPVFSSQSFTQSNHPSNETLYHKVILSSLPPIAQ